MGADNRKVVVTECIVVAAVVAAALVLQLFTGSFPLEIFAFPLNVITLALWVVAAYILYKTRDTSALAKSLLSIRATWLALGSMVAIGLYLGLQRNPNSTSWLVVVGILFALTHLLLITMRGWRTPKGIRWRFTLLHAGLIIALGAGFWGAAFCGAACRDAGACATGARRSPLPAALYPRPAGTGHPRPAPQPDIHSSHIK